MFTVRHTFRPTFSIAEDEAGRLTLSMDFFDSYEDTTDEAGESVWDGEGAGAQAAGYALDAFLKAHADLFGTVHVLKESEPTN